MATSEKEVEQGPGMLDAAVFAYTHPLLDDRLGWVDRRLVEAVEALPRLVRHRARMLEAYYSEEAQSPLGVGDSVAWEKV